MPRSARTDAPITIVMGGDSYLNERKVRDLRHHACASRPDAESIELDAAQSDHYAFDEAVGPSLLSDVAIVTVSNLQSADDKLLDSMVDFCAQARKDPGSSSIVIARHEGGNKGRAGVERLVRAGARKEPIPDLKKPEARLNFVMQCFERERRRVEPAAAQRLVSVLGDRTGELAAMCSQLCFDFDEDPIPVARVDRYLTSNPQVTGFFIADKAMQGDAAGSIISMRSAIGQGAAPIALVGALAMKLRTVAKAAAITSGTITAAQAKVNPWVLRNTVRQLPGWSSAGLGRCIRMLAWADEQCKSNGGDPVYALERCVETISRKGHAIPQPRRS